MTNLLFLISSINETFEREVPLDVSKRIGIYSRELVTYSTREYSLAEAVWVGTGKAFSVVAEQFRAFARLLTGQTIRRPVSGPIEISTVFAGERIWRLFAYLTGVYAMIAVYWNLLPLPKSAFWEILPLGYEAVTGRQSSYKVIRRMRTGAHVVFWMLIFWVFVSDLVKLL